MSRPSRVRSFGRVSVLRCLLCSAAGTAAACSASSSMTPVAPSSIGGTTVITAQSPPSQQLSGEFMVPPSHRITALGGLDLDGYCRRLGFAGSTLTGTQTGPNAAFNNWRCHHSDGSTRPFSMTRACAWQYGVTGVLAKPMNADDAFTWICYLTPRHRE